MYLRLSWGYTDSLKACFENVNIEIVLLITNEIKQSLSIENFAFILCLMGNFSAFCQLKKITDLFLMMPLNQTKIKSTKNKGL